MKFIFLTTVCVVTFLTKVKAAQLPLSPEQTKQCEARAEDIVEASEEPIEKILWTVSSNARIWCEVYFSVPAPYRFAEIGCAGAYRVIVLQLENYKLIYDGFESYDCGGWPY